MFPHVMAALLLFFTCWFNGGQCSSKKQQPKPWRFKQFRKRISKVLLLVAVTLLLLLLLFLLLIIIICLRIK